MIKFFKNKDIVVTKFSVAKDQVADNIVTELIAGTDGTDISFPIILPAILCDNNKSGSCSGTLNSDAYLADTNFINQNVPDFEIGLNVGSGSVFYPVDDSHWNSTDNPVNKNGTYKRLVYNTVKNMYYNRYNNCYEIFGFDRYNVSNANLNLSNEFSLFSFHVNQAGDTLRPNSIVINNQTGDVVGNIYDDGNNNLYLTGSHFVNSYEFNSTSRDLIINCGEFGLSYYLANT